MKGLLVKDIRLMLQQKKFFIMLVFVAVLLNFSSDSTFVVGYLTFVGSMFVLSTISYDEYDNCYPFLMTLPVDRKSYAKEKYLFGLILGVSAWMFGLIISLIYQIVTGASIEFLEFFLTVAIYIPILMLLLSIMIPFQLKYGGEKGRLVMLIVYGGVFLAGYSLVKLAQGIGIDIKEKINALSALNIGLVELVLLVTAVVALGISCLISFAIMEKKEF